MTQQPPLHREVIVDAAPDTAFSVFTDEIGAWWPLAGFSVHGAGGTVAFSDGRLVERSRSGDEAIWGSVTAWDPPARLAFTWHPGQDPDAATSVEVRFTAVDEGTLVTLEHTGWERFDDPAAARASYESGWPAVLGAYRGSVASTAHGDASTWVALFHTPGAAADPARSVFEQPQFREHIAFLQRMRDRGWLVAAGPLDERSGEGMTILRIPGPDRAGVASRLATEDDASVAAGFFTVAVRPWRVALTS